MTSSRNMVERSQVRASLATQGAWLMLARTVGFILAFALPLVIVRRLSQDAVGTYRQAFQIAGDAAAILTLGFNLSAFYYFNRESERRGSAALNILLFNFGVGALTFFALLLYPDLLGDLFQNDTLIGLGPKIGLLIWIWLFASFIEFAAVANQESRLGSLFIVATQLSKAILMIAAAMIFQTVESIINAALIQCLFQSVLLIAYLHSRFPSFWRSFDRTFFREQAVYAIPFGLSGMLWIALTSIHFYFVGHNFSAAQYAIYAYGCFQLPFVAMLSESAGAVLLPRMSELEHSKNYRAMIELIARAIGKLALYLFAIYAYLLVVSEVFVTTLFTEEYAASVPIFVAYLTLIPLSIWLVDPILRSFESFGRKLVVLRVLLLTVLTSTLMYAGANLTLQGIVWIVVGVMAADRLACVVLAARRIGFKSRDLLLLSGVVKAAFAAAVAGGLAAVAHSILRHHLPEMVEGSLIDLGLSLRAEAFVVGVLILGFTFVVFSAAYVLAASAVGAVDGEERRLLEKCWRLVARHAWAR